MIRLGASKQTLMTLKAIFENSNTPEKIIKKNNQITTYPLKNKAYIYLGKKTNFTKEKLISIISIIISNNDKGFNIDIKSFITKKVTIIDVVKIFIEEGTFHTANIWNMKTGKNKTKQEKEIILIGIEKNKVEDQINESIILAESQTFARNLQAMAPNKCTSIILAQKIKEEFDRAENVSVKVLGLLEIKELKMGLLQAVNMGSNDDAQLVVIEYNGNPDSRKKTVLVGKGITFDSGGINLKPGKNILGMKYDMSGAAVVAGVVKSISKLKPKHNVSAVVPITDNKISKTAVLPDSVWTSMNGKTVEINNTDAEGRLILADAITYAIRKLNATRIIDVATLTGAVLVALGNTFTGVWATENKDWELIKKISYFQNENIWRMPFHKDFAKFINDSKVADLKNTDLTGKGGSSSAAMFLKEFTEGVPYIHLDIAGTANKNEKCMGPMIKTLSKFLS